MRAGLARGRAPWLLGLWLLAACATPASPGVPPTPRVQSAAPEAAIAAQADAAQPVASVPDAPDAGMRRDALGDPLPALAVARLGSNRLHHPVAVVGLAFGADGRTLVSCGIDGELREWSVPSGARRRSFGGPSEPSTALSAARDGRVLAVSRTEGDPVLFDGTTGRALPAPRDLGHAAVVSADGRWLAVWGRPLSKVSILAADGSSAPRALEEGVDEFLGVTFDAGGTRVALLGRRRDERVDGSAPRATHAQLSVRDPGTGAVAFRIELPGELLHSAVFSPDGRRLFAGAGRGVVHVFDAGSGATLATWPLADPGSPGAPALPVTALAVSPDGTRLLAAHGTSTWLLDAATGTVLHDLPGAIAPVHAVAFAPDGLTLATACADHVVRLYDTASGERLGRPPGHDTGIAHVLCSQDGSTLCTIGSDGTCLLWPADGAGPPRHLFNAPFGRVSAAFSPDGGTLAMCASDESISLYDVATATLRSRWSTAAAGPAALVAYAPDGLALAVVHFDEVVRIWPLVDGRPAAPGAPGPSLELPAADGIVTALAWLPDGKRIAVGTSRLVLYDARTGRVLGAPGGTSPIAEIASTADAALLATANADRTVSLVPSAAIAAAAGGIRTLTGHAGRVKAAAFSPDGSLLASSSAGERIVHVWDVAGGAEVARLVGHEGEVTSLAFTPDGRALVSAGFDAAALVWAMPPVQEPPARQPPADRAAAHD